MKASSMPVLIFEVEGWLIMTDRWHAGSKMSAGDTVIYYKWGSTWSTGSIKIPFRKFADLVLAHTENGFCDLRGKLS